MASIDYITIQKKVIPEIIKEEVLVALSHYPELEDVAITFRFKNSLKTSVMKAQPVFSSLFGSIKDRRYLILMSLNFSIDSLVLNLKEVPREVLIGWIGHELGHIMDYKNRSSINMISFGLRYITSDTYVRKAEIAADTYAVRHGLREYILATKNFILSHADLSEKYKNRIKRLYMSPDEIIKILVEEN